ncbi:MAG: ketopantoate reductase family protein [Burkholderiales bacterium]
MKACVFGAGAIGGHLAAKLAAAGHEVSVIARGANLEAMHAKGLALHAGGKTIAARVRASERAADLGAQEVVFVTTKATGLGAFAERAAPLLGRDTAVVFVQNGVPWWYAQGLAPSRPKPPDLARLDPGGGLARAIAPERVIGAVVYSSNDLVEPGVIHNHTPGRNMLVLGEPNDRQSGRIAALRATLEACDMHSPPAPDIRQAVWDKLLINFGSTLCVPIGEPIKALVEDAALRALRRRVMDEGRAIAEAHGIRIDGAPQRPGGQQASGSTAHKPSMLQDYELGRPMEIEAILMAPLAFARAAGVPTPTLDALAAITARLAAAKGLYTSRHGAADGQADRPRR